jgi:hypothetical protein
MAQYLVGYLARDVLVVLRDLFRHQLSVRKAMKKIKVVSAKNLPSRWPFTATAAWWLLLDRFHAPPVAWGVFYTLATIVWIISIACTFCQESADPFERVVK